jgi:hypothetical protein
MPIATIISLAIAVFVGICFGIFIYMKWQWPRRWFEFCLVLILFASILYGGVNRGARIELSENFRIHGGAVGFGVTLALIIAFCGKQYIDRRLKKQVVASSVK